MKNKNNYVNFLLLTGIMCFILGCSDTDSSGDQTNPTTQRPGDTTQKPADSGPASISVNSGKLVLDFERNEIQAIQMYGGKRIRIKGPANGVLIENDGTPSLTFGSPAGGFAQTKCFFSKSQGSRLAEINGEVTVEGTVRGIGGGYAGKGFVFVDDCIVL